MSCISLFTLNFRMLWRIQMIDWSENCPVTHRFAMVGLFCDRKLLIYFYIRLCEAFTLIVKRLHSNNEERNSTLYSEEISLPWILVSCMTPLDDTCHMLLGHILYARRVFLDTIFLTLHARNNGNNGRIKILQMLFRYTGMSFHVQFPC